MPLKLALEAKPVAAEASIGIDRPVKAVFKFVAENLFVNYPKWADDVVELEALDEPPIRTGLKARQVRDDNGTLVESVFEITEFSPQRKLAFHGVTAPYEHVYLFEEEGAQPQCCRLIFRFAIEEVELFMRPFEKLLRAAIEEGAEQTVASIKQLVMQEE